MRQIRYRDGELQVEQAPEPVAGDGQLLIRAHAIGVTRPAVARLRDGDVPGGEVAGEVIGIGRDVDGWMVGDRVAALPFGGSYAEVVAAPAMMTTRIPDDAEFTTAVALVRSGHVALGVLDAAALVEGESVLVTAAASGVGHLLVQAARLRGAARVVAAASPGKEAFLYEVGADEVVGYDALDVEPVDVVLDGAGGVVLPHALAAARPGGRLVFFASGGGTVPAVDLLSGAKTMTGFAIAYFARTQPQRYAEHERELWELGLRPHVHAALPLERAGRAHEIAQARQSRGKVVLVP
ncbi:NADPH:quinone reductase-like Zn-dependent oxidoreductase [Actinoplanes octamycinicus]|uniref:NADPH:quinone reductase-like Zn-dependent oxidoreductase n=1 Tax=Actinoplanes octamycinicus TaxID=135948 RepID=A0A7W7H2P6_9ACTN|nr:zinc-binding dehydrogenase [Actinoplanes octamycinicus]MBB4742582.1 NADPH:quinone reductase-like Zn-dependent oxidoreductase [Actinoplanes octamycinicus]GIE60920.1 oxidoreductase [Actinoplanes octamycinicus]